jgi:parallel beta-helix repeat protein
MAKGVWNVAAVGVLLLSADQALARTVAVGSATCQPSLRHFTTIQAAVNASAAGDTVLVCPGTYPEQVVIYQALTLRGIADGSAAEAVITLPAVLIDNSTFGPAQLLIQNAVGVRVMNITLDGAGTAIPRVGIALENAGDMSWSTAGVMIRNVIVRNELGGGDLGWGIRALNSYFTVTDSAIQDAAASCVVQTGGASSISQNTITNCGVHGISVQEAQGATLTDNRVYNVHHSGIAVGSSTGIQVQGNTIKPLPGTVSVSDSGAPELSAEIGMTVNVLDSASVIGNDVSAAEIGLWFISGPNSVVRNNTFTGLRSVGMLTAAASDSAISNNTVNGARCGVVGQVTGPNTLVNVRSTVVSHCF